MQTKQTASSSTLSVRHHVRLAAPAVLVSTGVLLVVDHWSHFNSSDFTLLALIAACAAIQVLIQNPIVQKPIQRDVPLNAIRPTKKEGCR